MSEVSRLKASPRLDAAAHARRAEAVFFRLAPEKIQEKAQEKLQEKGEGQAGWKERNPPQVSG